MSDELPVWQEQVRNGCMRIIFLFFPVYPRRAVWRARIAGFSPENLLCYIDEYIKHVKRHMDYRLGPEDHYLLKQYVRDYQADTLYFTGDELFIMRENSVVETFSKLRTEKARRLRFFDPPTVTMRDYVIHHREGLRKMIRYDPILKRWLHIEKDTPEEMIIRIGPQP